MRIKLFMMMCVLGLVGCDSDPEADAGMDSGVMVRPDSGGMDARTDAGPTDPCAADEDNAASTVGCNGPLFGSTPRDNEIDGACTPDGMDGPGTCTEVDGVETWCLPDDIDPTTGICVYICAEVSSYVSTGDCPSGTRCFNLGADGAYCFRDCNSNSDCFPDEECDVDQSCVLASTDGGVPMDGSVPTDGSVPSDGSVPTDGSAATDGSAPIDGAAPADGSAPIDGGTALPDSGPPPIDAST